MPASHFGLDIGTHSIKIVEIEPTPKPVLLATGYSLTPPKALVSESPQDFAALATVIKQLVSDAKIETSKVVASLPESQIFTRVIEFPQVTEKELASSIQFEAEQYIPVPLMEVKLDYQIISQAEGKMEVLIVAAPTLLVNKFLQVFELAKLEPIALETEILATSRAVNNAGYTDTTLIISLGHKTTDICIVDQGVVIFSRSIATGGAVLARAVAQELGFELDQAEQYKRTYGLDESQMEGKVVAAIKPVFDIVVDEIRRAIAYFNNKKPEKAIKRVLIAGGTAKLPGLAQYLSNNLGISVELINPWQNIQVAPDIHAVTSGATDNIQNYLQGEAPTYTVAVGLALRA